MLLQVYFTLSLMYMQSFLAVSVAVFKLRVKVWNPLDLSFFSAVKIEDFANFKTL